MPRGVQLEFSRNSRLSFRIRRSVAVRELLTSSKNSRRVFRHSLCFFVFPLFSLGLMKTGMSSVLKCFNLCADFFIRFLLMSGAVFINRRRFSCKLVVLC